ncbi:MAG: hypothetical protein LDL26_02365, partial [Caenispirillum bisanense]|nr:hypothetical protein [Caenispirillum bisanense]
MMVVALVNVGVAVLCALLGLAAAAMPALDSLWQAALAPATAVAAAVVLGAGGRFLPGALAGLFAAAWAVRPEDPLLALTLALCIGFAVVWSAIYARHAVQDQPLDLVLTLRGALALLT